MRRALVSFLVFFVIAGCSQIGDFFSSVPVDTPLKRWAVAQDTLTAVTKAGTRMIADEKMPLKTAEQFAASRDLAQGLLDDALFYIRKDDPRGTDLLARAIGRVDELTKLVEAFR